jgi:serpin B
MCNGAGGMSGMNSAGQGLSAGTPAPAINRRRTFFGGQSRSLSVQQRWPMPADAGINDHSKLALLMTRSLTKLVASALMFSFVDSPREVQSAPNPSVVDGNTAFALELYRELKSTPGNLFFSPYSISTCLAMTYAGARGDTEKQMGRVLHLDGDPRRVHASFGALQRQLGEDGNQKGIQVNIANGLWARQGHPFLPAFLQTATGDYRANVSQADFVAEAEAVRGEINQWVAHQTQDKIRSILSPGSLSGLTRLVLANAIYFKGAWAQPYDKAQTSIQPFHVSTDRTMQAPLMHHYDTVKYAEDNDLQAVELPYQGGALSMLVLLPRRVDGCGGLEDRLTPALLSRLLDQMRERRVEILLPRFKLESELSLNDALAKMGMPDAFGSKADFSGMDGTRFLYISGVFHKAWGEVNEEGTEAAAATAVVVAARAVSKPPPPPPVFRADHPFVLLIRDTRSGSILFMGRLTEPSP